MKKDNIILISVFIGVVGIFLIIAGAIVRGQVRPEVAKPAIRTEAPMRPEPPLKRRFGLQDLEAPGGLTQAPAATEEGQPKEREYELKDISMEEALQVEDSVKATESGWTSEEGGPAGSEGGQERLNVQPPADKLKEMKMQGVVIY